MPSDQLYLGEHKGEGISVPLQKIVTGRTAVIGQSGSGKSHFIGIICEELCKKNAGFAIVDPEGEYSSLKRKFEVLWAGPREQADVPLKIENAERLANEVLDANIPLILDVSECDDDVAIVSKFCKALYELETKLRKPYLLIVEEADRFAPQSKRGGVEELQSISRRGRKRGIGLTIATQRPAMVDKNILSQCGNQFLGKLTLMNDLEAVKFFFQRKEDLYKLPNLEPGQFFIMGDVVQYPKVIKVRKRETPHGGFTPTVEKGQPVKIAEIIERLKEEIEVTSEVEIAPQVEPKEIQVSKPKAEEKVKEGILAIPFVLTEQTALAEAEKYKKRKFGIGAPVENITNLTAYYHPIIVCKIKALKRGILGRKFVEIYSCWDGATGEWIKYDPNGNLERSKGFSRLHQLNENQVMVLKELSKGKDLTPFEIAQKTKLSKEIVTTNLRSLREKGLTTTVEMIGRTYKYAPLVEVSFPNELENLSTVLPQEHSVSKGEISSLKPKFSEDTIRKIIKGMFQMAEVEKAKLVYYPYYCISLTNDKGRTRKIYINGYSGKLDTGIS
ncbi:MAG: DUF87 domain-containing protein [Euryarchaeota archaeon]|nr:DUF87 domain-containing protein [Euryarchaeota archaeon]